MTEYREDPYTARLVFKNILPVCKITDSNGDLLYLKYEIKQGDTSSAIYSPAVFTELTGDNGAFTALEGDLYYASGTTGNKMTDEQKAAGLQIQMLVTNYTLKESLTVPAGMKLTMTTASKSGKHPYRGEGNTATITRAFTGAPMLVNNGDLMLENITLDGAKVSGVHSTQDGGIVKVNEGRNADRQRRSGAAKFQDDCQRRRGASGVWREYDRERRQSYRQQREFRRRGIRGVWRKHDLHQRLHRKEPVQ